MSHIYSKTVIIFNFYESATSGEAIWIPHTLKNVHLDTDRGAIIKKYGSDSTDNAELHIPYTGTDEKLIAGLPWLPPKAWKAQTNDLLSQSITFSTDDFFMLGEWDGGTVNDEDYRDGFYHYMNTVKDFVFKITSVGGPYTVIPHFEILGK